MANPIPPPTKKEVMDGILRTLAEGYINEDSWHMHDVFGFNVVVSVPDYEKGALSALFNIVRLDENKTAVGSFAVQITQLEVEEE